MKEIRLVGKGGLRERWRSKIRMESSHRCLAVMVQLETCAHPPQGSFPLRGGKGLYRGFNKDVELFNASRPIETSPPQSCPSRHERLHIPAEPKVKAVQIHQPTMMNPGKVRHAHE